MGLEIITIDVVIPVKNGEMYITQCLESVFNQTYPVNNVIVVNDHSTDRTVEVVTNLTKQYKNLRIIHSSLQGVSEARNAGIENCFSEFVALIDSDDLWSPTKIEQQVRCLVEDKSDYVYSSYSFINEYGAPLEQLVFKPVLKGNLFEALLIDKYVLSGSASGILIRRDCLMKVGAFDSRLFIGEDWDMWIRLAKVGKYSFVEDPLTQIRVHNQSAQRRKKNMSEIIFFQHLIIFEKWANQLQLPAQFLAELKFMTGKFIARGFFSPFKFRRLISTFTIEHPNLFRQMNTTPLNLYFYSFKVLWGIFKHRTKKLLGMLDEK